MRLLGTCLAACTSRRDSLHDDRSLQAAHASRMNDHRKNVMGERRTRVNIQLRAKPISVMGYGCRVTRQYSRSSSASDIGSAPGRFLKPTRWPLVSSGSTTHSCVKLAKSASYTHARSLVTNLQGQSACARGLIAARVVPDYRACKAPSRESRSRDSP